MIRAREAARQTIMVVAARFIGAAISMVAVIAYTRLLTKDELAVVIAVVMLGETCYVMADLGLGLTMERRLPAVLETDRSEACAMIASFHAVTFGLTVLLACGICVFAGPLAGAMLKNSSQGGLLIVGIPAIFAIVWRNCLTATMRGVRAFRRLSILSVTTQVTYTLVAIGMYLIAGLHGFVLGMAIGYALPCAYESWRMRSYLSAPRAGAIARHVRDGVPYFGERCVNYAFTYSDQWIVSLFLTPAAMALYYVPRQLFDRLTGVLDAFWMVPMTMLSRESAAGAERLRSMVGGLKRIYVYLFSPMALGMLVSSLLIIDVLAGRAFRGATAPFAILCVLFLVSGVYAPHSIGATALAPPRSRFLTVCAQNAAFLICVPLLAPLLGLNGVVTARLAGGLAMAVTSWWVLNKVVPQRYDGRALKTVLLPCVAMMLIAGAGQVVLYRQPILPVYVLATALMALGGVAYVALFMRRVSSEDLLLLEHMFPSRLAWILAAARRLGGIDLLRASRSCSTCGYDLTGNVSGRCPACGAAIASAAVASGT